MNFHRPPNTYVGQVYLKVENLERAIRFYTDLIGFQILEQTGNGAQLTVDGQTPLLVIEQPENVIPKLAHTAGLYHFAILLPDREALALVVQHLAKKGYPFGSSDHLVSEALYLSDPDGNGIEIYADRLPSTWNWNEDQVVMTVDPLDFEDLLASSKGGSWERLPHDTVMGHIHLHVANLPEAEQFYRDGLGFDVVCHYGRQATFLSTGGYHHHVALNTWAGVGVPAAPENSVGLKRFTLEYPDEAARSKVVQSLKEMGVALGKEQGNIQVKDPSGNVIQLNISRS